MGVIARIDPKIYREIKAIQDEFSMKGINITFPEASRIWRSRMKTLKKSYKFPMFS